MGKKTEDGRWQAGEEQDAEVRRQKSGEKQKGLGNSEPLVLTVDCQRWTVDSPIIDRRYRIYPGDDRLSHAVPRAVPWALEGLTTVFGMGTGGSPPV